MFIDEELLGYYIDAHGNWPHSFIWVFLTLMGQHMESQAASLLDDWFDAEDHSVQDSREFLRALVRLAHTQKSAETEASILPIVLIGTKAQVAEIRVQPSPDKPDKPWWKKNKPGR